VGKCCFGQKRKWPCISLGSKLSASNGGSFVQLWLNQEERKDFSPGLTAAQYDSEGQKNPFTREGTEII
jgi:hypothetical protein